VSIQSLVLVSEPFYNEPYDSDSRGLLFKKESEELNRFLRRKTIEVAMLQQIQRPSPVFASVSLTFCLII